MAVGDREATMILRAADLSSQPIKNVVAAMEKLLVAQQQTNESAKAGTVSTRDFKDALENLQKVAMALGNQQSGLRAFEESNKRFAEQQQKVLDLRDKYQARLAAAGPEDNRTEREVNALKRLAASIDSAEKKLAELQNTLQNRTENLARMGVTAETVASAHDTLQGALSRLVPAMREANVQSLSLRENQARAAAETKVLAENERQLIAIYEEAAKAAQAANRQAQTFARPTGGGLADRSDEITQKHLADLSKQEADAEEKLARRRATAAQEQAQQQAQLRASQNRVADAQESLPAATPLGVSLKGVQDFSSLSQSISAIVLPTQAARQTLAGLEAEVTSISDALGGAKRRTEDYQKDMRDLLAIFLEARKVGTLVDVYRQDEAALKRLTAERERANQDHNAMIALYERSGVVDEAQVRRINTQFAAVRNLTNAQNVANEKFVQSRAAMEAAGIGVNTLDSDVERLTSTASRARAAYEDLEKRTGQSGGDRTIFLGLRGYELQNLSYQINDVVTQLSSGTSVSQTLAQQGGQFIQLWTRQIGEAIAALLKMPVVLGAIGVAFTAATLGVLAFIRAIDQASEQRNFAAELTLNVDGARLSIDKLMQSAKDVERLGVAFTEAAAGARTFAGAGFNEQQVSALLRLSANLSIALRKPFADVVKEVTSAFSGGYNEMVKFTTQFGNLIDAETHKAIEAAYREGDANKARTIVLALVAKSAEEAAAKERSAFGNAFQGIRNDWHDLLGVFSSTSGQVALSPFRQWTDDILGNFHEILTLARAVIGLLPGVGQVARPQPGQPSGSGTALGGGTQAAGNARGDRNNNPGNLEFRGQEGAVNDGRFAKFVDQESGVAAALRQYLLYQERDGLRTIQEMVEKATPPKSKGGDNPDEVVAKYVKAVAGELGVAADKAIDLRNRNTAVQYVQAVARQEGNAPPTEAVAQAGVSRVLGARPGESPFGTTSTAQTNAQQIATDRFSKAQQDITDSQRKAFANEGELYGIFQRDLDRAAEKVRDEADKAAAAGNATALSQEEVTRRVEEAQDNVRKQYHEAWVQRLREREGLADQVRNRELGADKTNLQAQQDLVRQQFEAERRNAQQLFAKGNYGLPSDQIYNEIDRAEKEALDRTAVDVAKTIVDDVVKRRDADLKVLQDRLKIAPPSQAPAIADQLTKTNQQYLPAVEKAIGDANKTLDRVNKLPGGQETEAVRTQRAQFDLTRQQAQRPEIIGQAIQQAGGAVEEQTTAAVRQAQASLTVMVDAVRVGGQSASSALSRIVDFGQKSITQLREVADTTNAGLRALAANQATSPQDRLKYETQIKENELAPSRAAVEVQTAILAVLNEDKQRLDKLLAEYKQAVADLDAKIRDGRLSPLQAASARARLDAQFIPQIAKAGQTYQQDLTQAKQGAQTAGLSTGFRADLSAEQQRAATLANPQSLQSQSDKDAVDRFREQARTIQSTLAETTRTQQELLRLGATTQTEAEHSIRDAFGEAQKSIDDLKPAVDALIQKMIELGNVQGAKKLAADFQLLQAQVKYVDPLVQQLTQGLAQSVASQGVQAFDTVAKAIGTVAVSGGKLKDVFAATGQAFAQFTAGVLKDIATIIIKYELLKLVSDSLGIDPKTGEKTGSGGLLAKLFGLGASAAGTFAGGAAEAGAFSGAGVAAVFHTGGLVGSEVTSRRVDLSVFHEARRMHSGGLVGLAPDEVPTILQRGERVMTAAQQQRQAEVTSQSGGGTAIRNVLAVGNEEIAAAMNGSHGEKVVLNILKRNAPTVKNIVG